MVAQVRKRVKSGTVALRVKCDVVEARGRRGWMRCFVLGFFWHVLASVLLTAVPVHIISSLPWEAASTYEPCVALSVA